MIPPQFPDSVDVLIVGAGPAGLTAAKLLSGAARQLRILLIDARVQIGSPLRCAELTYRTLFGIMGYDEKPGWIRWALGKTDNMVVLDRPRMESEMARSLADLGVQVLADACLVGIGEYCRDGRLVTLDTAQGPHQLLAGFVIAADGVSSQTARLAGLTPGLEPDELCACLAYRITDARLADPHDIVFDHRPEVAPYYFWLIPSGPTRASVGVGVAASRGADLEPLLDRLLRETERIQGGVIADRIVGAYPSTIPLRPAYADGLLVAGGAGRFVDAIKGEGIREAAYTGRAAAEVYLERGPGQVQAAHLASYPQKLGRIYRVLEYLARVEKPRWAASGISPAPDQAATAAAQPHRDPPQPGEASCAAVTDRCVWCTGCASLCPAFAIRVVPGGIQVLSERCDGCGRCARACPVSGMRLTSGR